MCPLKREQARREMQQWVMRRLPTADSIVEIGRNSRSWIKLGFLIIFWSLVLILIPSCSVPYLVWQLTAELSLCRNKNRNQNVCCILAATKKVNFPCLHLEQVWSFVVYSFCCVPYTTCHWSFLHFVWLSSVHSLWPVTYGVWLVITTGRARAKHRRQIFLAARPVQSAELLEVMFRKVHSVKDWSYMFIGRLNASEIHMCTALPNCAVFVVISQTAENLACQEHWILDIQTLDIR